MVRSEHVTDDDQITLATLEHVAHCPSCFKEREVDEIKNASPLAEAVYDLVHEFQLGWTLNAPDILRRPHDTVYTGDIPEG